MYQQPFPDPSNDPTMPSLHPIAPPPPIRRRSLAQWYRAQSKNKQAGCGCLMILVLLFVCGSALAVAIQATPSSATTSTPTTHIVQARTSTTSIQTHASTPTPTAAPTQAPAPTANPCPNAPFHNPWCYDFNSSGKLIFNPDPNFCSVF
ncbi:MAG: hypothetical protein ACRDHW_09345, partial [Ktedonobacteraceae bacterium]